ncbi:HAD family hydrolase [Aerococcus urinaehominis]|uniref:HAD family hydrolase n=1 Tax=Aerococcus urinaehominis TaxID=128944 RepID=A0A109RGC7_9LACT|nr:Cof-type HAD-IIB family hydrolase [Aerococcus urinaehominis]AMB98559.1 HAD family hydrolase [Aerococcus urinaehominis]SDL78011.1 hypothetical protein SAMN04487985_10149 [Aerococcus urinaehominis]
MTAKKIIFLDIDGTLVDYHNQLPASAKQAIQLAQANGHQVYAVTGRSKAEIYQDILDLGLDGYIGGNGNYIESQGQVVCHQLMSGDQIRQIVDWLNQRGLAFYLESNSGLYASASFAVDAEPAVRAYMAGEGQAGAQSVTVAQVFPEMIYGADLYRDDVNKVSFVLTGSDDLAAARQAFPDLLVGSWGGQGEEALFGDLALAGVNKQTAIASLLDYLGLDRANSLAFGDAKVDIPMLEYCQVGVAMGSGGPEIKAMADYVTAGVNEDGLYQAFKHFGLI